MVIRAGSDLEAPIGEFTRLHLIGLSSAEIVSAIGRVDRLEALVLTDVVLSEDVWVALAKHAGSIETLKLESTILTLGGEVPTLLGELERLTSLLVRTVHMGGTTEEAARKALTKLRNVRTLSDLDGSLVRLLAVEALTSYRCGSLHGDTLEYLSRAATLEELVADNYEIVDQRFALLGRFTSLRTLILWGNVALKSAPADSISALSQLVELRNLTVGEFPMHFSKLASVIAALPKLQTLHLQALRVSEDELESIGRSKSLRTVILTLGRDVTADGILAMCTDSQITKLDLTGCDLPLTLITGLGKVSVIEILALPRFVDDTGAGDASWADRMLSALCECRQLRELTVPGGATGRTFRKVNQLKQLVSLNIEAMTTPSIDDIKFISELEKLETLTLGEEQCIREFPSVLAKCLALKRLEIIWFSEDMTGLFAFLTALPVDQLRAIVIHAPSLADHKLYDAIVHNKHLVELKLVSFEGCTAAAIDCLAQVGSLKTLEVYVGVSEDADDVARALCSFRALESVKLYGWQMTGKALKKIATESGVKHLATTVVVASLATLVDACKANPELLITLFD